MKRFLIALFIILLGAPGAWAAEQNEAKVVTAKGEAAIQGDLPAAKERAREAALREAVNQVVGTTVTSVSEMADFTLVRDVVSARPPATSPSTTSSTRRSTRRATSSPRSTR
jgi:hypothetical protein